MRMEKDFLSFVEDFRQNVISRSEVEDEEKTREDVFTELMVEYLEEFGEIEEPFVASFRGRGMQINGYSVSEDEECLDLLISIHNSSNPPINVRKSEITTSLKRIISFVKSCFSKGLHFTLEESSPGFDMAIRIHELKKSLTRIRVFLLTDGFAKLEQAEEIELSGIRVSYHLWDIERLYRCWSSGRKRETIEINLELLGSPIPCLVIPNQDHEYETYLAVLPGTTLVNIYEEYGPRLLERNVRSFLQARGDVNKGIRNTIRNEPHMFLAFNNGISATAEAVEVVTSSTGKSIKSIKDLQIVNGGQTTASIYHATKKDKSDVTGIFVQMKLTVLNNTEKMDEVVPRISEYANSQNKIQTADFSANDPFHRAIEEMSRTIWAPAFNGGQRQTRWFYERARGQYSDLKGKEQSKAQKKVFEATNPLKQWFTKTDLAKFENTWNMLPHFVSRGAQKNFKEFTVRMKERGKVLVDEKYFQHLVAKAILFRRTEKLVHAQSYGGHRANIVTYTLSRINHATAQRIDLDRIWREQSLTTALEGFIIEVSKTANEHIRNSPNGGNYGEWAKKEDCWKQYLVKDLRIPDELNGELIAYGKQVAANRVTNAPNQEELEIISQIMNVPFSTWLDISSWAKETSKLLPWQRSLAFSLGKLAQQGRKPSRKQAIQGVNILQEAKRLGFNVEFDEVAVSKQL